jgi:DNA invertase Pin-like site-specific DNA recombinase
MTTPMCTSAIARSSRPLAPGAFHCGFGYARVSTQDQDLSSQVEALEAAGATTIYREKISGVRADRPQLAKLMAVLKLGDVVRVSKLDRLGRSTRELLDRPHQQSRCRIPLAWRSVVGHV